MVKYTDSVQKIGASKNCLWTYGSKFKGKLTKHGYVKQIKPHCEWDDDDAFLLDCADESAGEDDLLHMNQKLFSSVDLHPAINAGKPYRCPIKNNTGVRFDDSDDVDGDRERD